MEGDELAVWAPHLFEIEGLRERLDGDARLRGAGPMFSIAQHASDTKVLHRPQCLRQTTVCAAHVGSPQQAYGVVAV